MSRTRSVISNVKNADLVAERREQILRAAIEIILMRGFHAATASEIADRVGIAQGSLYNYVRSKGDILYLICDEAVSRYHDAVAVAIEGVTDPRQRLVRAIRAAVEAQVRHRNHILIVMREGHALDPQAQALIRDRVDSFFDRMKAMVAECAPDAVTAETSAALLAEIITYLPTMAAMRRWRLRQEIGGQALVDSLCLLLFRMLQIEPDV
ncbi:TetR/AcrR family transcriptional regulator [Ferrovibrio sp.]|uniref:TetR/AcrR family transcriptional regulator n=1 Tax=Ferrovibrio sp. TaxID=1917215 RepID=UPI003D2CD869